MSNEMSQQNNEAPAKVVHYATFDEYRKFVDTKPRQQWVKSNPFADNSLYLPIGIVEELLNKIFPLWQVEQHGEPKILGNSVVISVHLMVFHPVLNDWVKYAGVGAVPIEVKKGAHPTDFTQINSKAMHKNVPAALSFAVSNAAKKIGKIFGSHLNRKEEL
ncbi:hypothetical protein KRE49_11835 [Elizabethkingia meningoseptica]|uniref:hypothetical protein n=1 Tax=Elizabethkingia meningoseptica TaxID=238 RepID=UPI0023AF5BCE|nr:hypothetical protein [Elizabethkingia meningoseptica]MDE5516429.1 hypothetical protein [Elizabethkingia meningoseptica]MDE5526674.1 hypothetical protein [Elizabethkingia meningoseptica]MDN4033713.1 hypothetical protein [Elizabethkingia meningoseptica]